MKTLDIIAKTARETFVDLLAKSARFEVVPCPPCSNYTWCWQAHVFGQTASVNLTKDDLKLNEETLVNVIRTEVRRAFDALAELLGDG